MSATTKQKPITEQLTLRQSKYVRYRLQGYSQRSSALKAGYSKRTAQRASLDIEAKPQVRVRLQHLLERRWQKIVRVIDEGLGAQRCVGQTQSGEPLLLPDHSIRLRIAEIAAWLGGMELVQEARRQPRPEACDFQSLTAQELDVSIRELAEELGFRLMKLDEPKSG